MAPPTSNDLATAVATALAAGDAEGAPAGLASLVAALRPGRPESSGPGLDALADWLEADPSQRGRALGALVVAAVSDAQCVAALTEAGVPSDESFLDGLVSRLERRTLPALPTPDELGGVTARAFPADDDYTWLRAVPGVTWRRLLDQLGLGPECLPEAPPELRSAIQVLAHRIACLGLSPEFTHRFPDFDSLDSPFLLLSERVLVYVKGLAGAGGAAGPELTPCYETLAACRAAVERLRASKHIYGTSLRLTRLSFRLLRQIERLELLLRLTEPDRERFQDAALALLCEVVEDEETRDHLGRYVKQSADLLIFQVVEHAARKGEKYITTTPREYGRFFVASLGGGLIGGLFALAKLLLTRLELSMAAEAAVYSVNYAICFMTIYLCGGALATKQPAMTANTLARSMVGAGGAHQIDRLTETIVRAWRSQFVSFVGNLACAFPTAIALAEAYRLVTGAPLISAAEGRYLLATVHPWEGATLFFAGVAGVFLFSAGLVSGYFDNRDLHRGISARIARHPGLVRAFGERGAQRAGAFVSKHGGVLAGNAFLGVCLGSAGTIGAVLGLPFDIRHIAFSSANLAFALEGGAPRTLAVLGPALLGVALIGFVNFVVSFGATLSLAVESRQITLRENREVVRQLLGVALRRPWAFFVPPLRAR